MENIANNLKDPSWWFTAFFVAIFASVIAGFLKDKIASMLGGLSKNLRAWKEKKEKEQEEIIEAIKNNDMYMNIARFRGVVALILFAISVVIYSTSVVIYSTTPVMLSMASQDLATHISIDRGLMVWNVFTPIFGIVSVLVAFKTTSRLSLIFKAIRKYREMNGLPKIP